MYQVTSFEAIRSYHFRKMRRQIQCKGKFWQKVMNINKHLANSKVLTNLSQF